MKFSNFSFSVVVAFALPLFFSPIAQASVTFAKNWKQWEAFPWNEKRVTKILEKAGGRVGYAATRGHLYVIAAPHRTPGGDPYIHLTVAIQDPSPKETCHVHLTERHGTAVVHDITCQ